MSSVWNPIPQQCNTCRNQCLFHDHPFCDLYNIIMCRTNVIVHPRALSVTQIIENITLNEHKHYTRMIETKNFLLEKNRCSLHILVWKAARTIGCNQFNKTVCFWNKTIKYGEIKKMKLLIWIVWFKTKVKREQSEWLPIFWYYYYYYYHYLLINRLPDNWVLDIFFLLLAII